MSLQLVILILAFYLSDSNQNHTEDTANTSKYPFKGLSTFGIALLFSACPSVCLTSFMGTLTSSFQPDYFQISYLYGLLSSNSHPSWNMGFV